MKNCSWKTQKSSPEVSQFSEDLRIFNLIVQLLINSIFIDINNNFFIFGSLLNDLCLAVRREGWIFETKVRTMLSLKLSI